MFRGDAGLRLQLAGRFDRQVIELHKWDFFDSSLHRYKIAQPTLLQALPAKLARGAPVVCARWPARNHRGLS